MEEFDDRAATIPFSLPPEDEGRQPYAGTISHHLLVLPVIGQWFFELRRLRCIDTFIIISPGHFRQGNRPISLSSLPWRAGEAVVRVKTAYVEKIRKDLRIREDRDAMHFEHGIGALIPCLHRYFPEAEIVPIVLDETRRSMKEIGILEESIVDIMKTDPGAFLLISIDFSHGAGITTTMERDKKNEAYLRSLESEKIFHVYADNIGGLSILEKTVRSHGPADCVFLYHTDSYRFSGKQPENITSYFFTYYFRNA